VAVESANEVVGAAALERADVLHLDDATPTENAPITRPKHGALPSNPIAAIVNGSRTKPTLTRTPHARHSRKSFTPKPSAASDLARDVAFHAVRPRVHRELRTVPTRRACHEDQIVNLGLMATDFPQYRLSFDRPE
jgi:hypothetical protein